MGNEGRALVVKADGGEGSGELHRARLDRGGGLGEGDVRRALLQV